MRRRLPKPPWYDRLGLTLLLWSLPRQPEWIGRHPTARKTYVWRADTGPVVLVTLTWRESDGTSCTVEFRTGIVTMIKTLIEFTEKLPESLLPAVTDTTRKDT